MRAGPSRPAVRRGLKPLQAAIVKSDGGERCQQKVGQDPVRCDPEKASASEPLMKCRNAKGDVKTGRSSSSRDQSGSCPEDCPSDIRHVGGAKPDQALVWNVRTWLHRCKGRRPSGQNRKDQSTDAGHRGGAARSRAEGSVMGLDRRSCVVQLRPRANR